MNNQYAGEGEPGAEETNSGGWIFPNPKSCLRLFTALLKEWYEDYNGRKYLNMDLLAEFESERYAHHQVRGRGGEMNTDKAEKSCTTN